MAPSGCGAATAAAEPCAQAALGAVPRRLVTIIAATVIAPRKLKNCINPVTLGGERLRRSAIARKLARSIPCLPAAPRLAPGDPPALSPSGHPRLWKRGLL